MYAMIGSSNGRPPLSNNYLHIPIVPHKAAAEVSKIGNLYERSVVVNPGWQSESTDGLKGAWSCIFPGVAAMITWSVTSPTTAGCSVV